MQLFLSWGGSRVWSVGLTPTGAILQHVKEGFFRVLLFSRGGGLDPPLLCLRATNPAFLSS